MPEISAADLRRLEALEGRLRKATDARASLAAERRELRDRAKADARRLRELEKEAAANDKKLEAILAENSTLAASLDEATTDLESLRGASLELREKLEAAEEELQKARESAAEAQGRAEAASSEREGASEALAVAREQLAGKSAAPALQPKEVAGLVEKLVSELGDGLPGLEIRDGELQLKVAVEKIGRKTGFVVPSAESPQELREATQSISLRFGKGIDLPGG